MKQTDGAAKTELQSELTGGGSALAGYRRLVLGEGGLLRLFRYEIAMLISNGMPGALGFLLRKALYPGLLGGAGRGAVFGRHMVLRHPAKIVLGKNVVADDLVVLDAKGDSNGGIEIGDNVIIGRGTVLSCKNGDIRIGRNANIAMACFIQSAATVEIGENTLIAAYAYVIGGGDHETARTDIPVLAQAQRVRGIRIGPNCWVGAGAKVLDGVTLGRDVIVGAGAVVTRDLPDFAVAAGVPARVLRIRGAGGAPDT